MRYLKKKESGRYLTKTIEFQKEIMDLADIITFSVGNIITIAAITYQVDKHTSNNFHQMNKQLDELNRQIKSLKESERR
jgi:hypothetical protein